MNLHTYDIEYTKYVRIPVAGGTDSEFSHKEVQKRQYRIIAESEKMARALLESSYSFDEAFKILSHEITQVDAIVGINRGLGFVLR